jgi:hypothetical protein
MSFNSQSLTFHDEDEFISQSFSQFNFEEFTLPSQTQQQSQDQTAHHLNQVKNVNMFNDL